MQSVTYVAGPATVQLRLNVIPRNPTTSSGVNFTSARPFPFALVSSVAVGMTRAGPVQSRLVGKTFRNLLPRSLLRLRSGRVDYGDINGLLPGRALVNFAIPVVSALPCRCATVRRPTSLLNRPDAFLRSEIGHSGVERTI